MNEISRQTVCLVSPPSRASSPVLPLSLMYLDAWLKRKGIECRIVDIKRGKPGVSLSPSERRETVSEIVSAVADARPAWVGVTCFTPEFEEVIALSRRIKQRVSTRIVAGGVHATVRPGDFFYEDRCVDFVIRGDGQEPLAKLVAARDDGITKERIEGVSYADSRGTAMDGGIAVFDEWDRMPLPDYGQLDMAYYVRPHRRVVRSLPASGLHVFTAFGCPFSCTFCANRKRKIRNRPISRVLDELEHLKKHYRIDAFYVLDDTFCLDKRRVRELTGGLKSRGLGFFWAAETRAGLVDAETLSLLRDSGCIQVDFGVESGSDRMLKSIRKGITRAQVLEAFSLCRRFGMRTYANVLLNLPGETAGDIDRTCDLLRRIRPTRLGINLAVPFPGTAIYRRHVHPPLEREEYGIYNHPDLYLDHVDRRFVLAEHALDLKKLRIRIKARFDFFRSLVDWTGNRVFWSVLLRSERKGAYLRVMFSDMVFERLSRAVKIGRHLASGLLGTKTRRSKSSEKRESSG